MNFYFFRKVLWKLRKFSVVLASPKAAQAQKNFSCVFRFVCGGAVTQWSFCTGVQNCYWVMWQFCTNTTCKNTFLNKKHFFRLRTQSGFCIEIMQKWYWVTLPVQHERHPWKYFFRKKYAAIMNFYFFRFLIFFCDDFVKRFKVSLPTVLVLVKPVTKTDIG